MAGKKHLKVNGRDIVGAHVYVSSSADVLTGMERKALHVSIRAGSDTYRYEIRHVVGDISVIEAHVRLSLEIAQKDFLDVEIREDDSLRRLSFNVQKIGVQTYIGWRLMPT